MPVTWRIRKDARLITCVHAGEVGDSEFLASYEAMLGHPDFRTGFARLVDLRAAASSARSSEALRTLATMLRRRHAEGEAGARTAIVAPSSVSFGLGRMFEAFGADIPGETRVFRGFDEAVDWLGVPADAVREAIGETPPAPDGPDPP